MMACNFLSEIRHEPGGGGGGEGSVKKYVEEKWTDLVKTDTNLLKCI